MASSLSKIAKKQCYTRKYFKKKYFNKMNGEATESETKIVGKMYS